MNYIKFKNGTNNGKAFGLTSAQQKLSIDELNALDIYECILINERFDPLFYELSSVNCTISDGIVTLENVIVDRGINLIKGDLYKGLKPKRDAMLFGEIIADNISIVIEDERDMQVVTNLGVIPVKFKRATGDRVLISIEDGILLKQAYLVKVQAAFDWEETEENEITSLTTIDELKDYYNKGDDDGVV